MDSPVERDSAEIGGDRHGAIADDRAETSAPSHRPIADPRRETQPKPGDDVELPPEAAMAMLSVDARKVVGTGTVLFGLAFLGLLVSYSWLGEHGHRVWLWTALAGFMLGAASFPLIRKHTGEGRLG